MLKKTLSLFAGLGLLATLLATPTLAQDKMGKMDGKMGGKMSGKMGKMGKGKMHGRKHHHSKMGKMGKGKMGKMGGKMSGGKMGGKM